MHGGEIACVKGLQNLEGYRYVSGGRLYGQPHRNQTRAQLEMYRRGPACAATSPAAAP
jgi:hypothetical protein